MRKPPLYKSIGYALRGILFLLKNERNFQIECLGFFINLLLISLLSLERWEAILILLISCVVLAVEAINTCIEKLCDFVHPEYNFHIGIIKNISAAAVVISVLAAILTAIYVYIPHIISRVSL
ncbi:diacylglycerol kinase family protein [Elizabethkingia argentiflava]|uniref:Diacylglycerol kinase family protein n=1 Tax=Elizabethkingia argenteiflava TaxID=2681556 RepID=A0A845PRN2_9FLAO|nr:diacylglycerol kinase [Elizabethkingia argenteiflava]NAW50929.1 diacylglycerol kinase family protein [Elizabethkingia argenteiflava]